MSLVYAHHAPFEDYLVSIRWQSASFVLVTLRARLSTPRALQVSPRSTLSLIAAAFGGPIKTTAVTRQRVGER